MDLWGVALDQEKAGKVMVDAYRLQAHTNNIPQETIEETIQDYQLVLKNDKSVADRKGEIVDTLQELAEEYIEKADDPRIRQDLEDSLYQDFINVTEHAQEEGYNIAIFTTRKAEWIRDYIDNLGTIYDAQDGKTVDRIEEIITQEEADGKTVVSFTEDADKALKAAKDTDIPNLIYLNRGDNGMTREECEEQGIIYAETLDDVYESLVDNYTEEFESSESHSEINQEAEAAENE